MNLHNASYDGTKETSRYYVPHHTLFLPLATPMLSYSHYSFAQALTTTMYRVFELEMSKLKVMDVTFNQVKFILPMNIQIPFSYLKVQF